MQGNFMFTTHEVEAKVDHSISTSEALETAGAASNEMPPRIWAEVDLEAVRHNVRVIKKATGSGRLFMACVKGDGYGHGMVRVAKAALQGGADRLSVAHVEEGIRLRQAGIMGPIQVLMEPFPEDAESLFEYDLIPSINTLQTAHELANRLPGRTKVHVEVDTGMGRVPLKPDETLSFLKALEQLGKFEVEGLFSHFSSAHLPDDPGMRDFTTRQFAKFQGLVRACQAANYNIPIKHMAASSATAFYPDTYLDMIRPGFLVYGYGWQLPHIPTKPVLAWKTWVDGVRRVDIGEEISYNRAFAPKRRTMVAAIRAGYADGYPRALSNRADVLIRGQRARVVGLVGMDQMFVEIDHIPAVAHGDEVVLIGSQDEETILATELAHILDTTPAEISCGISARVPRAYLNE